MASTVETMVTATCISAFFDKSVDHKTVDLVTISASEMKLNENYLIHKLLNSTGPQIHT